MGIESPAPLSQTQLGMLFEQRANPQSGELNVGFALEIDGGATDEIKRALQIALRWVVKGAPHLRESGGTPWLEMDPDIPVAVLDAGAGNVEAVAKEFLSRPFDLLSEPLVRAALVCPDSGADPGPVLVMFAAHHIVCDFQSLAALFNALLEAAEGKSQSSGESCTGPTPGETEEQFFASAAYAKAKNHFTQKLAGMPRRIHLPADARLVDEQGSRKHGFELSPALKEEILSASARLETPVSQILNCLVQIHLHAMSGQERLILGVPATMRKRDDASFGCYINTVPIPAQVSSADTFESRLASSRRATRGALRYRAYAWPTIVHDLRKAKLGEPTLDALYNFYDFSLFSTPQIADIYFGRQQEISLGKLRVRPIHVKVGEAGARMAFTFGHVGERIYGEIQAAASLLDETALETLCDQFEQLALALLAEPQQRILNILTIRLRPHRNATVWAHLRRARASTHILEGEEKVSFRSVSRAANALARVFESRGVRRGMPVMVDLPRSREWLITILALWKLGAVYVPVWSLLCDEKKLERARAARAEYVISHEACWKPKEFRVLNPATRQAPQIGSEGRWRRAPEVDLAYLLATSGTTGAPKLIGISHEGMLAFARTARETYGVTMLDRILAFYRPDRDPSIEEIMLSLRTGADLVLNPDVEVYSVTELLDYVERLQITVLHLPTAYFHELMLGMAPDQLRLPRTVRIVIVGGEALTEEDLERWWRASRRHTRLINSYGLTETTIVNTAWQPRRDSSSGVRIGGALDNTRLYLFDAAGKQSELAKGQTGELFLGGPCVAYSYGETVPFSRIRLSPIAGAGLLYRSYDLVRCTGPDELQFLHRLDGQIKVAGDLVPAETTQTPQTHRKPASRKPQDPLGCRLAMIYAEVVGHEEIGEDETFFELGGSSLLAVRVLARIRGEFGASIPYAQFLKSSSVAGVVKFLSASQARYEPIRQAGHLLEPFWQLVDEYPEKIAIVSGETEVSFRELREVLVCAATNLASVSQDLIPVKANSRVEEVIACMGIACAGRAYVSIDRKSPIDRIQAFLDRTQSTFVVSDIDFPSSGADVECMAPADLLAGAAARHRNPVPATLAYACMTSGSSGAPKAVLMQHERALNTLRDVLPRFQLGPADVALALSPMSFDLSVFDVFGVLGMGGRLIVPEGDSPDDWLHALERHQVTIWNSTPGHMQMFLDLFEEDARDTLGSLRLVMFSGDFLSPRLVERLRRILPDLRIVSLGGATEAGIWSNFHEVGREQYAFIPYGRALDGQGMEVIDASGENCEPGVKGEIVITGGSLADGYYGEQALTAKAFRPHPLRGEPTYFTGDEGYYMENGEIAIVGRLDRELKIRGYRVHLAEVESAFRDNALLRDATVQVDRVNDRNELVLYAVLAKGATQETLRSQMAERVPEYMLPRQIVEVAEIPRTSTGKVDAEALRSASHIDRKPEPEPVQKAVTASQGDGLVDSIRTVFALQIGIGTVGEQDDFFVLGGNSLNAAAALSEIHAQTGVRVPLVAFSRNPTPYAVAAIIRADADAEQGAQRSVAELELIAREHITKATYPAPRRKVIRNTLITGATGSLGSAMLAKLGRETRTRFLVLGRNAPARLPSNMRWIRGDLRKERFGLTNAEYRELTEVDSIIHLAAQVNFAASLNALLPANVEGTRRILELAATGSGKTLHYFSTAGVFPYGTREVYLEDDPAPRHGSLLGGYAQSKWIAEELVRHARDEGLRTVIYRPGFVANEFAMQDLAAMIVKVILRMRAIPDVSFSLNVISREYAAECFRSIWKENGAAGRVFHINNPKPITLGEMQRQLGEQGTPIRRVPFDEWRQRVIDEVDSTPDLAGLELLRGLDAKHLQMPVLDCRNTLQYMSSSQLRSLERSVRAWMAELAEAA